MTIDDPSSLERRILKEIGELNAKMAELAQEKLTLERLLLRARRENLAARRVTRKNSVGRALVEQAIIDTLAASPKPVRGSDLYEAVRKADFTLKEVTFRSHVHRMKERGIIENPKNQPGWWALVSTPEQSPEAL